MGRGKFAISWYDILSNIAVNTKTDSNKGALLTMLYDADGTHYQSQPHSNGLSIYADGALIYSNPTIPPSISVPLAPNNTSNSTTNSTSYVNILTNPNAPYSLPSASSSYLYTPQGDSATSFDAWKTIDNLLWYDFVPDNRWTANQSATPFTYLNYTLPRPRSFSSISLAMLKDTDQGGVIDCPESMIIYNTRTGAVLADRTPWTSCTPNALNTIDFDTGVVTTDEVALLFTAKQYLTLAISETQIWIPAESGPQYEAEDSLMGAFIGGFEGRFSGGNSTLVRPSFNTTSSNDTTSQTDGGVVLGEGAWIEWAGVQAPENPQGIVTVIGAGSGTINVGLNFIQNVTVTLGGGSQVPVNTSIDLNNYISTRNVTSAAPGAGRENVTASGFNWLYGGNVVTLWRQDGMPFIDAIVVG